MPTLFDIRIANRAVLPLFAAGALALAACSDNPTSPNGNREPAINFQRLLVADAEAATARLFALHDNAALQTFTLSVPASLVYRSHSGRLAVIHQRTADRVQFLDAGVWTHDDEAHRDAPQTLPFQLQDGLPTHENVNGDWISVYFDGSGIGRWVRESQLVNGSATVAFEANTGAPHHGGSFTIVVNNQPFFAHSLPNPAGGSPLGVAVRNPQGQILSQTTECPSLHGNNSTGAGGVFGCNDGLVIVRGSGASAEAVKATTTGDMAGLGLRNAYTNSGASYILGQFAALPGQPAQRVLATIDPATGTVGRLPALPSGVVDHWRAVEPVKERIVLLGTDGTLYIYSAARQLQHTVSGVVPALPASGPLTHQVAVVEDMAAVASPYAGEVVLVNLNNGSVTRRMNVGGRPSRIAILGALRGGEYRLHD